MCGSKKPKTPKVEPIPAPTPPPEPTPQSVKIANKPSDGRKRMAGGKSALIIPNPANGYGSGLNIASA